MATVQKSAQSVSRGGLAATYNGSLSTTDTYNVPNDGRTILHFKKSGANACTASFLVNETVDGIAVPARTVTIPATTGDKFVGPFPPHIYGSQIAFTLSEVTGLTFAAVRI